MQQCKNYETVLVVVVAAAAVAVVGGAAVGAVVVGVSIPVISKLYFTDPYER